MPFFGGLGPCLVGMEACATAHYWAREIARFGHEVRLMPPSYVKPYVKRNKSDAADAEAICEAATRKQEWRYSNANIRFQSFFMLIIAQSCFFAMSYIA